MERELADDVVRQAETEEEDPTVLAFLRFLEKDIAEHPERLRGMPVSLYLRVLAVTDGVEVDLGDRCEGSIIL